MSDPIIYSNKNMTIEIVLDDINLDKKEEIYRLFANVFDDREYNYDVVQVVLIVKTILKSIENYSLAVKFEKDDCMEEVWYVDNLLNSYFCNNNFFRVHYQDGMNLYIKSKDINKGMKEWFSNICDKIDKLKDIKAASLNDDSKALYKIYELFYREKPDFSFSSTRIRTQSMMSILEYYGISLGDEYSFNASEYNYIYSRKLNDLMNSLVILGGVSEELIDVTLSDYSKNIIKMVRDGINEYVEDGFNDVTSLVRCIASLQYVIVHNMPNSYKDDELSSSLNMSKSSVKSKIKILDNIDYKINNQD